MKTIKRLLLILLISSSATRVNAQLINTAWNGEFRVPKPTECTLVFKPDTMYVLLGSDINPDKIAPDNILETSSCKISHDTLTIHKISGRSPCSEEIIGKYSFEIKDGLLSLAVLDDDCGPRASAFPTEPLTPLKRKE